MKQVLIVLIALLLTPYALHAQVKIGDNLTNVNANSILELESTTKALLLPRLNNDQIQAMQNVPAGMLVYSSTDNVLMIRTNSGWTTLALAANAASATNPWSTTTGSRIYTSNSRVGIGTNNPSSQLSNTPFDTKGSDGLGGNAGSLSWSATQAGYVGQIYNGGTGVNNDGLAVKVNSTTATALDVSQGPQNGNATPLLTVKSDGRVGINTASPQTALDVNGQLLSSGVYAKNNIVAGGSLFSDGNITGGGNLNLTGSSSQITASIFNIGVQYVYADISIPGGLYNDYRFASCPIGTKLIGGGGGHRDVNSAASDITIHYSGPDKIYPNMNWGVIVSNINPFSSRVVRVYAICAKVN